jgi:hypothetical protein
LISHKKRRRILVLNNIKKNSNSTTDDQKRGFYAVFGVICAALACFCCLGIKRQTIAGLKEKVRNMRTLNLTTKHWQKQLLRLMVVGL